MRRGDSSRQFHEEDKIAAAKQGRGEDEIACIPEESAALAGLGRVSRDLVEEVGGRGAEPRLATVDQDATIPSLHKLGGAAIGKLCAPMRESGDTSRCWRYGRR